MGIIKTKRLITISIAYIYAPILLFLFSWVKWYIALPVSLMTMFSVYKMVRGYTEKESGEIEIALPVFVVLIAAVLIFCYYMGYTGGAPQSADWNKHNAMLHDLTTRRWPVYYDTHERSMLTYYIAQYLIPALLGKLCVSFTVTQYAQYIWNTVGVLLVVFNLLRIVHANGIKKQIHTLLVFFFYGGMLLIAQAVLSILFSQHIGWQYDSFHFLNIDECYLQYRSNLVSLRWVFQQCIVPWIVVLLLYENRRNIEHYAALLIPIALYGALPMLGLLVFAAGYVVKELFAEKWSQTVWKKIFSPYNIMTLLSLGVVLFCYFSGNILSKKPKEIGLHLMDFSNKKIWIYLIFCLCMYGIYAACIWRHYRRNTMFWIAVGSLSVIPFFRMGAWNDFCMGVSIPAQFLMMVFVLKFLFDHTEDLKSAAAKGILVVCLCIGAIYPAGELYQVIAADRWKEQQTADDDQSMQPYADRFRGDIGYDMQYNYYTYDVDKSVFINYFARKKMY